MADPRVTKMAQIIVDYTVPVRVGNLVTIRANTMAEPLVRALYLACLQRGGYPELVYRPADLEALLYTHASESQLERTPVIENFAVQHADVDIAILSPVNTRMTSRVPAQRIVKRQAGRKPMNVMFDRRELAGELRWALTIFPTEALAQDAGMSLAEYEDLIYAACKVDHDDPVAAWLEQSRRQDLLTQRLHGASEIRIIAPDTDLTFSVAGRTWLNADGRMNLPDGEVYVAPVEDSAEGYIHFNYPAVENQVEVEDARLWFAGGKVVRATASKNEAFLHAMLDLDDGARLLGEFAFGMNDDIKAATGNVLLDEKIGGTVHLALGSSAGGSDGKNESGLHWDMVTDLRPGGEVHVDGILLQKDGEFVD